MKYIITSLLLCLAVAGFAQKKYHIDADKTKLLALLKQLHYQNKDIYFLSIGVDDSKLPSLTLHLNNVTLDEILVKILEQCPNTLVGYLDPWTPNCLSFHPYEQGHWRPGEMRGKKY